MNINLNRSVFMYRCVVSINFCIMLKGSKVNVKTRNLRPSVAFKKVIPFRDPRFEEGFVSFLSLWLGLLVG